MNKELAEEYGTEKGAAPALAHIVGNLVGITAGMALSRADKTHQERLLLEAELMDQRIRQLEAERMGQMIGNLKHASVGMAEEAGALLARAAAENSGSMDKQAFIGTASRALTGLTKAFGKGGARAAARAAGTAGAKAAKSKPLLSKGKLLAAGGALGATAAGLKGLQTARDYMMVPSGQSMYGSHSPRLRHQVNRYGYPQ